MADDRSTDEDSADVTDVEGVTDDDDEGVTDAAGGAADPATDPLVAVAREAYESAHVPYSEYPVGAALRATDGTVFSGCNIENANYSNSLHAEEVALASAVQQGYTEFDRIAVSSAASDGVTPCGMCRQTLAEFCDEDLEVICDEGGDDVSTYTLGDLLPETISQQTLEDAERRRDAGGDGDTPQKGGAADVRDTEGARDDGDESDDGNGNDIDDSADAADEDTADDTDGSAVDTEESDAYRAEDR